MNNVSEKEMKDALQKMFDRDKKKTRLIDSLIGIALLIGSVFILKNVLMSFGETWNLPYLATMTWEQYWGLSFLFSFSTLYKSVDSSAQDKKIKNLEESLKKAGIKIKDPTEYKRTHKALTYIFTLLIIWGITALVHWIFF